jgi:hypothetical protein
VTSHSFIKTILSEDSESCGKTTLEIFTFFVLVGKFWWPMQLSDHVAIYQNMWRLLLLGELVGLNCSGGLIQSRFQRRYNIGFLGICVWCHIFVAVYVYRECGGMLG